jgi:hypothetical protein
VADSLKDLPACDTIVLLCHRPVGQMAEIDPEQKYLYVGGTARCDT